MKFTGKTWRGNEDLQDAIHAVQFVANKATNLAEGQLERVQARSDALEGMLGRLLNVLTSSRDGRGRLLSTDDVAEVFDYDVLAED